MKIFIIGFLILLFLVLLDIVVGRIKQQATEQRTPYPIRKGNLEIFIHGKDLFDDFFKEIKSAKDHVHVLFYIVRDDQFSQSFFELLKMKAQEGVEVCLLLDWLGSNKVTRQMVKDLEAANVKFAYSNKPSMPLLYMANVRNHRKISIIDGKIGYLGGYNVGKEYVDLKPKLSPWRDYHLKITGEAVQDLQREFLRDWQATTKSLLLNRDYFPEQTDGVANIQFVPSNGVTLEDDFSNLIRNAKTNIFIGTPYFIPSKRIFNDLLAAIERGVKLKILVPCITDHPLVQEASYHYFRRLLKAGANIHQYMNGFYHAKVFLIDDQVCDIGTANFDKRSLFLNYEMNCLIYDPHIISRMKIILDKDAKDSKKMSLQDLNQLGLWTKVKEVVARVLSPVL